MTYMQNFRLVCTCRISGQSVHTMGILIFPHAKTHCTLGTKLCEVIICSMLLLSSAMFLLKFLLPTRSNIYIYILSLKVVFFCCCSVHKLICLWAIKKLFVHPMFFCYSLQLGLQFISRTHLERNLSYSQQKHSTVYKSFQQESVYKSFINIKKIGSQLLISICTQYLRLATNVMQVILAGRFSFTPCSF